LSLIEETDRKKMLKKKMDDVTLVQIISALLIVNYHTGILAVPVLKHVAAFGFIFNTVFVFLSGYLLSQSLSAGPAPEFKYFIYKRINRIYPSYHISLLVITLIYLATGHEFTSKSLLLAATGFAYYFGDNTFGLHLWFVSIILVCYLLCIPTYYFLKRHPMTFFIFLTGFFLLIALAREGTLNGLYNKVSSDILYRLIYHYIVFSLAIYMGIINYRHNYKGKKWIGLFAVVFPLYIWLQPDPYLGVITIFISILLAICVVQIILISSPFFEKHLNHLFLLSSVTYELYLVHYSVIGAFNIGFHGKYVSYPLVFIFSITLAFMVLAVSKPYSRLTRRCTGWLSHYGSLTSGEL
jgi:peptidoglycan/LPS O-acetylase OafA/YrhL